MGKYKDVGDPAIVLMEELAEAIQVIAKKHRFDGDWNEIPVGKDKSRWEELQAEMADVFYQWFRLKEQVGCDAMMELSDWECGEGTLHPASMDECDCAKYNLDWESNDSNAPDYEDTQDVEWPNHVRSSSPEYIIASTSFRTEETYVFEGDIDGKILDFGEYGGIAKRWGIEDWTNHELAVREAFDVPYRFERKIETGMNDVLHFLYSKVTPADYWDGE